MKGGDVAIYVRDSRSFTVLNGPFKPGVDDTTEICGVLARRISWSIGPDLGSDHLPMLLEVRTGGAPPKRIRKTRWSFKKADWLAFQEECEAAFAEAGPEHESVQELATRFHQVLEKASVRHIPRGARTQPRPWALDPELKEAVNARRAARRDMRSGDRSAKERWVEAKRRAASVERRVSQRQFIEFVSTTLNKHQSLGRVHKTLKMWEPGGCLRRPAESR